MSNQTPQLFLFVLARDEGTGRIVVDFDAFLRFNARIDEELSGLVDRWADNASPSLYLFRR